ncbi:unnamed protein product [Darwinula stevensoni]|uniref:Uncharacterized protein n=1 Tax=Darwinula stevensoni TaxID=69355 RepID=A0A7R8X9K8_9CRUS|nr:unnamed protein product [Darwinula stevensoni]CAG0889241.1 unnamed protein product [Darwinula stevensoni]
MQDFVGQKRAERLFQIILTLAGLVLPPWPMYRCNNLPWQKAVEESSDANSNTNTKSSKKKKIQFLGELPSPECDLLLKGQPNAFQEESIVEPTKELLHPFVILQYPPHAEAHMLKDANSMNSGSSSRAYLHFSFQKLSELLCHNGCELLSGDVSHPCLEEDSTTSDQLECIQPRHFVQIQHLLLLCILVITQYSLELQKIKGFTVCNSELYIEYKLLSIRYFCWSGAASTALARRFRGRGPPLRPELVVNSMLLVFSNTYTWKFVQRHL